MLTGIAFRFPFGQGICSLLFEDGVCECTVACTSPMEFLQVWPLYANFLDGFVKWRQ